jgi:hypothetical protein
MRRPFWLPAVAAILLAGASSGASADPDWCYGPEGDQFSVTLADSTISVLHHGARYNCSQDSIEVRVELDGTHIVIHEYEIPPGGYVMCMCCYDLSATVRGLAPGAYLIEAYWREEPTSDWSVWTQEVLLPDAGQSGTNPLVNTHASDCLDEGGTPVDEAAGTWSAIKALFR